MRGIINKQEIVYVGGEHIVQCNGRWHTGKDKYGKSWLVSACDCFLKAKEEYLTYHYDSGDMPGNNLLEVE